MAYLSYLKDSLNDCIDVLDNENKQVNDKNLEKEKLISEAKVIESRLRKKIEGMKNPIIEEKLSLQSEIARKEQQLFEIESNLKILMDFRKEDERLEKLKKEIHNQEDVISRIEQNEEDKKKEDNLMDVFRDNFNSFFNNTIYPYFERGYIENNFGIEITTSKDGTRTLDKISSASDKVVVRLGLFYSIIKTAIETDEVNHPRLLYLDSPRDQELTWERFCEALTKYKELMVSKPNGQIFITIVIDGNNKFEGKYDSLNSHVFMNITNKDNEMLLRQRKKD